MGEVIASWHVLGPAKIEGGPQGLLTCDNGGDYASFSALQLRGNKSITHHCRMMRRIWRCRQISQQLVNCDSRRGYSNFSTSQLRSDKSYDARHSTRKTQEINSSLPCTLFQSVRRHKCREEPSWTQTAYRSSETQRQNLGIRSLLPRTR